MSETATSQQIRDGYKRAALKCHPDRVAADAPDRPARTRKFQLVNDAYFTLSDRARRREYDAQRKLFAGGPAPGPDPFATPADEAAPGPDGPNLYSWAWDFFARRAGAAPEEEQRRQQQNQNAQFSDAFEEMMQDAGLADQDSRRPSSNFWSLLGGLSGAALGFILANMPGMVAGAVAGNRLGAIRDSKGKSVYAVFQVRSAFGRPLRFRGHILIASLFLTET